MKKFIALALALAMMVSCLVFTASAEASGVEVLLQGPATAQNGDKILVEVRVGDNNNVVGGIQGTIDVTGATLVDVVANPELLDWNNTQDVATLYKATDNDVAFAALNSLNATSYDTRLWFKLTYEVTDAAAVSVELKNVKVSDKTANLINDVKTTDLAVDVVNPTEDAYVTLNGMGMPLDTDNVMEQALMVEVGAYVPETVTNVTAFGVVFYPTSLLAGDELTVETEGAIVAEVSKEGKPSFFNQIVTEKVFSAKLKFGFSTPEKAYKFLGTKVTARAYFKTVDGSVVYASNPSDNKYINNGTAKKAALNVLADNGDAITAPVNNDKAAYDAARKALNTSVEGWMANRDFVLKYVVANYAK